MRAPLFGRIAILGSGLIGGSLAAALVKHHVALDVAVHDAVPARAEYLSQTGYAHSSHAQAADAVKDADVVVFAVPASALEALGEQIAPHLKADAIITDVSSIKRKAIESITLALPHAASFVPGHPIAGSEKSGAEAANPDLFEEKRVILTPGEAEVLSEAVARTRGMWEAIGAHVELMPPELHDRIYAYVSHLPQIVAYAAAPCVGDAAEGCEGIIRLAQSNPSLWADIALANRDYISEALAEFSMFVNQMTMELTENAPENTSDTPQNKALAPSLLAAVSGLSLVATALLLEQRTGIRTASYGGTGFKSMTGAAGMQSDNVLAAISENPAPVADLLNAMLDRLNAIGAAISVGSAPALIKLFARS